MRAWGVGQPPSGVLPVSEDEIGALQRTGAVRGDAVRVSQRGEHRADDPQAGSDPVPAGKLPPYRGSEPVLAQAAHALQIAAAALQDHGSDAHQVLNRTGLPAAASTAGQDAPQQVPQLLHGRTRLGGQRRPADSR
jgi:hypothetical protein